MFINYHQFFFCPLFIIQTCINQNYFLNVKLFEEDGLCMSIKLELGALKLECKA